jgi:predicted RNase H-like HicB family nuclease
VKWDVVLEQNPATQTWIAEAVGVPGCYTQGATRDEALANIKEALELVRATEGLPKPPVVELVSVEA